MSTVDTIALHGGYNPGNGEPRQVPIYQSTTWKYATSEDMGKLFDLEASGYFYTRLQNPTNDFVASKLCAMEGGFAGMLTCSGQAANFFAVFNICEAGDHFIASANIYGGTYNLFGVTFKKMGIECTFVDQTLPLEELQKYIIVLSKKMLRDYPIPQFAVQHQKERSFFTTFKRKDLCLLMTSKRMMSLVSLSRMGSRYTRQATDIVFLNSLKLCQESTLS